MPRRWKSPGYLKVRRWVDRDLMDYPRHSVALQGALLAAVIVSIGAYAAGPMAIAAFWLLVFPAWAVWTIFVLWRVARLTRAASIKGDRQFDQKTKYMLPPEYAESESVSAAGRRKRRATRPRRRMTAS